MYGADHGQPPYTVSLDGPLAEGETRCQDRGRSTPVPGATPSCLARANCSIIASLWQESMALALEPLNLMPVCPQCHNVIEPRTGSRRQSGCDEQGRPTDPQHPWNAEARGSPGNLARERSQRRRKITSCIRSFFSDRRRPSRALLEGQIMGSRSALSDAQWRKIERSCRKPDAIRLMIEAILFREFSGRR